MTHFIQNETGAVTVDWVVLTAALVGLGLATMAVVNDGVEDLSGDVENTLQRHDIIATSFGTYTPFSQSAYDTAFADAAADDAYIDPYFFWDVMESHIGDAQSSIDDTEAAITRAEPGVDAARAYLDYASAHPDALHNYEAAKATYDAAVADYEARLSN